MYGKSVRDNVKEFTRQGMSGEMTEAFELREIIMRKIVI